MCWEGDSKDGSIDLDLRSGSWREVVMLYSESQLEWLDIYRDRRWTELKPSWKMIISFPRPLRQDSRYVCSTAPDADRFVSRR